MDTVCVIDNECVSVKVFVKEAPLRSDAVNALYSVNAFDCVNVFDIANVLDWVNVNVGQGGHPSINTPFDMLKSPNVSL